MSKRSSPAGGGRSSGEKRETAPARRALGTSSVPAASYQLVDESGQVRDVNNSESQEAEASAPVAIVAYPAQVRASSRISTSSRTQTRNMQSICDGSTSVAVPASGEAVVAQPAAQTHQQHANSPAAGAREHDGDVFMQQINAEVNIDASTHHTLVQQEVNVDAQETRGSCIIRSSYWQTTAR